MFPPGLEPGTFRVLGERDNRYTTETLDKMLLHALINLLSCSISIDCICIDIIHGMYKDKIKPVNFHYL